MLSFSREYKSDPSTQSNIVNVVQREIDLALAVDFQRSILQGTAVIKAEVLTDDTASIVLDTLNLVIGKVEVDGATAKFQQKVEHEILGSALEISLNGARKAGTFVSVLISYHTTSKSKAAQWLPPLQTSGKRFPYLFTQCQAIHARSLLPCQDSPSAKFTYKALIDVPDWATCLMSALSVPNPHEGAAEGRKIFRFSQPVPISSYLIAIAVGELSCREISPRCKIWTEPSMLNAAAFDFSQTEDFIKAAEEMTCPYQWTRYDLLCLPPSFPYGGMENPCMTFLTPTLLSGDKSLASVVAHEIAHSWTGNLITNRTWQSFWLNEGFTRWLEHKIVSKVTGNSRYYDSAAMLGFNCLKESVEQFASRGQFELTALCPPLENVDPDDSFSSVPYEKGFLLLDELEQRAGEVKFSAFVKAYIEKFKFGVIDSSTFANFVMEQLSKKGELKNFDWECWLFEPGMPKSVRKFNTSICQEPWSLANEWLRKGALDDPSDRKSSEFGSWSSMEKVLFLNKLLDSNDAMAVDALIAMDCTYNLSCSTNSEVLFAWCMLCLKSSADFIVPTAISLATSQGRMKFTRPLYRSLYQNPKTRELATRTFIEHSDFYHIICRRLIAKDIGVELPQSISRSLSRKSLSCEPLSSLAVPKKDLTNDTDRNVDAEKNVPTRDVFNHRWLIAASIAAVASAAAVTILMKRK